MISPSFFFIFFFVVIIKNWRLLSNLAVPKRFIAVGNRKNKFKSTLWIRINVSWNVSSDNLKKTIYF